MLARHFAVLVLCVAACYVDAVAKQELQARTLLRLVTLSFNSFGLLLDSSLCSKRRTCLIGQWVRR